MSQRAPTEQNASPKRLLQTLSGIQTDRAPFWFMRQAGRYLPEYLKTREDAKTFLDLCFNPELAEEVTLQPIRRFHPDAAILFADILLIPHAVGQHLEYRPGEGPVLDALKGREDIKALDKARLHDVLNPVYETVARLSRSLPEDVALIGFAGAPFTVACYMVEGGGSKEFAKTRLWALKDPEGFQMLIDLLVDCTTEYVGKQIEAGAEAVQLFDSWSGVLSAPEFDRWSIAPVREITRRLKDRYGDVPVIGFPRGAGAKMAGFPEKTGVDAISLDTSVPVDWAARTIQPQCVTQGNLDPLAVVAGGAAMEEQARAILKGFAGGPHIFNLGHGFVPETPPEHVARLVELLKEVQP